MLRDADFPLGHWYLGLSLLQNNQPGEAKKEIKKAVETRYQLSASDIDFLKGHLTGKDMSELTSGKEAPQEYRVSGRDFDFFTPSGCRFIMTGRPRRTPHFLRGLRGLPLNPPRLFHACPSGTGRGRLAGGIECRHVVLIIPARGHSVGICLRAGNAN